MNDDLDSMPTMKQGARVECAPVDEDSLKSMPGTDAESVPGGALGRIDQYELVRKLGGGGFGVVYLARDAVSGVEYALKTLHPLLKTNAEELERVRENFALVAKLAHPNIATAHVLHRAADVSYASEETRRELRVMARDPVMVMSYAPGVTLSAWRRQFAGGVVPFDKALEICRQVASALDYAHSNKIVHRDIKPGNVMVEDNGGTVVARVLDFGLAAEIRSSMSRISQEKGETSGTRPYMAPEQWEGRKQDGRADQYALACMAYELLSGAPPFAGAFETGDMGIMERAVTGRAPESVQGLPRAANAALLKALSKKREDRFASCGEFVAALGGGAVPAARPAGDARPRATSGDMDRELIALKIKLSDRLDGVPRDLSDAPELKPLYAEARSGYRMAEEALKAGMKDAALGFLREVADRLEAADAIIAARREAERKAREEAERRAREEAARKTREEAERKAREREESERKAREEAYLARIESVAGAGRGGRGDARGKGGGRAKWIVAAILALAAVVAVSRGIHGSGRTSPRIVAVSGLGLKAAVPPQDVQTREVEISPGVKMEFVWVAPGSFRMGSDDSEADTDEMPVHQVTLTEGYWLGKYEVTQAQWKGVMGNNPSSFKGDNRPVENVSWDDCQSFVARVNAHLGRLGEELQVRLPTEAEWEYAARGGTNGRGYGYSGGNGIDEVAWYDGNSGYETHEVGTKAANELGLHDMSGNVWEWCADWGGSYASGAVTDPTGPASGSNRVDRGGSWFSFARYCRSAVRDGLRPSRRGGNLGFRLCCSAGPRG